MTFLLDIINGFHKFLWYLNISPKYLNRAYTILSLFPTIYILRIVYGLWINQNYIQFSLYLVVFIILLYFVVLNFIYYFFNKNVKGDVTQLFVKYLPEDVFNIEDEEQISKGLMPNTSEISIDFVNHYEIALEENIQALIDQDKIPTNNLTNSDGFLLMKNTLHPYYYLKKMSEDEYELQIGTSFQDLEKIGIIHQTEALDPVGLFIVGGDFVKEGVRYHERYHLKLLVRDKPVQDVEPAKKIDDENNVSEVASRSQRHKKKNTK
ncbi:hypothetical protein LQF67_02295 [Tetragenococcus halophilus]|uniref:DUF6681 family protein n=1 Tax=Tetragenococcus halophilus TaxID=51669 RepID=UPI001F4811AB|nr:DUF6681 family protein [Tetragenococcus halophilus]MCF1684407.1 hypothetical protein [Tetragenococcus halophilus]